MNYQFLYRIPRSLVKKNHDTSPRKKTTQKMTRVLNAKMAVFLYKSKTTNPKLSSSELSKLTGLNEKTIRDVWSARTWAKETWHLDPRRWHRAERIRGPGRPVGSKDKQPRTPRPQALTIDSLLAAWDRSGRCPSVALGTFEQ